MMLKRFVVESVLWSAVVVVLLSLACASGPIQVSQPHPGGSEAPGFPTPSPYSLNGVPQQVATQLSGVVFDARNNQGLTHARVEIQGRTTITDSSGKYSFQQLQPGKYRVTVSAGGYETVEEELDVKRELGNIANFELTPRS